MCDVGLCFLYVWLLDLYVDLDFDLYVDLDVGVWCAFCFGFLCVFGFWCWLLLWVLDSNYDCQFDVGVYSDFEFSLDSDVELYVDFDLDLYFDWMWILIWIWIWCCILIWILVFDFVLLTLGVGLWTLYFLFDLYMALGLFIVIVAGVYCLMFRCVSAQTCFGYLWFVVLSRWPMMIVSSVSIGCCV